MKLSPMRFCSYTWHHNPKKLAINSGKKIVQLSVPYGDDILHNFGDKLITISGTGELYGENCLKQYEKLEELFKKGESGVLCLPQLSPVYACFSELSVVLSDIPNVITYKFTFTQIKNMQRHCDFRHRVYSHSDQTLWDIAYSNGKSVQTLVEKNPDIMFLNDLREGDAVLLC